MGGKNTMRLSGGMWHKLKILITDFSFLGFCPSVCISFLYGRFHFFSVRKIPYFFIVRNIPLLYYCTEYGIFRYHVKAWTRFSGLDLTSVGGLELPIKGGYIFMSVSSSHLELFHQLQCRDPRLSQHFAVSH